MHLYTSDIQSDLEQIKAERRYQLIEDLKAVFTIIVLAVIFAFLAGLK